MGGPATYSGTQYQATVIAYVYAHMLAAAPLDWFHPDFDVPVAVEPEIGTGADDFRVEFHHAPWMAEVQVKHGLQGGRDLEDTVQGMFASRSLGRSPLLVVVGGAFFWLSVRRLRRMDVP